MFYSLALYLISSLLWKPLNQWNRFNIDINIIVLAYIIFFQSNLYPQELEDRISQLEKENIELVQYKHKSIETETQLRNQLEGSISREKSTETIHHCEKLEQQCIEMNAEVSKYREIYQIAVNQVRILVVNDVFISKKRDYINIYYPSNVLTLPFSSHLYSRQTFCKTKSTTPTKRWRCWKPSWGICKGKAIKTLLLPNSINNCWLPKPTNWTQWGI